MHKRLIAWLVGVLVSAAATASPAGPHAAQLAQIQASVEQLVRQQTAGFPGKISYSIGAVDPRLNLPACATPEAFVPPGTRLWGNANVGVRCQGATPWTLYIPVTVKVMGQIVIAATPLPQGHVIEAADLAVQDADLTQLSSAVVTDAQQAIGRYSTLSIAPGQALRQDLLRAPPVIQQGQSVTLLAQGSGFKVSAAGKAVNSAAEGQVAQVRTSSGRTISGIARKGAVVEIQ